MTTPSEFVSQVFSQAQTYASNAQASLTGFTTALNNAIYAPPTISVTWAAIAPPSLPSLPTTPTMPTIAFTAPVVPTAFNLAIPDPVIGTFGEVAPVTTFPVAPVLSYGATPTVPTPGVVAVPTAPTIVLPGTPTLLSLTLPTFAGVNVRADFLAKLETIPTLTLVAPTPYSYSLGPAYASSLLTAVKAKLLERVTGGSGLTPAVEQAIWDRGRSRETAVWSANTAEIARTSEALGFHLPPGVVAAQQRQAQETYYNKLSDFSRDVSIKQADLEQKNLEQTITVGMELEGKLIDYSYRLEQLTFESAKIRAQNAIDVYNAQIENYKALLSAYQTYAIAYDSIIKGELAKVTAYKAQIDAEMAKAEVNKALVEQYKASIEANMSLVEIFKAQVSAAQTLVSLEQTKISAVGEQIKAYVAQVNAETAKIEAYKAGVDAEATKVEVYKIKADVFGTTTEAQISAAKLSIARFEAFSRAKVAEFDGYRAQVEAENARMGALGTQSRSLLDGYRAGAAAVESSAAMYTRIWEGQIKNYEASQGIAIQVAKINGDAAMHTNASRLDASKVGAQVYAQLAASAYAMMKVGAQVEGRGSTGVTYQYTNETTTPAPTLTAA